ncbi:tyrosine-type recombinase/integrase [Bosea thiooxidans]|nr:integrase arm-type DNA-binding domain-containing protein [Bosea sp. (in: a-proteobacteria)]
MARNLLTAAAIKAADKPKLRDGDGLWLHRAASGAWYWAFIYTRAHKRRELGFGRYGALPGEVGITLARKKADDARAMLAAGKDPYAEIANRRRQADRPTFGKLIDEYIEAMKSQWRGRQTAPRWRRFADVHAEPLRKLPVADVGTDDIVKMLKPIWSTKAETAMKCREMAKQVLDHAKARGLRSGDNPAEWKGHLDKILPKRDALRVENHPALPYPDLPDFFAKLMKETSIGAQALAFTILTAARSGETRGALWTEIDLDAALWTVPAARMKEGREHRVPLSPTAVTILKAMKAKRVSDFVFPGGRAGAPLSDVSLSKPLGKLGAGAYTVHGFRSTFRDWCGEATEFQREVAEAALAHAVGDTAERAYRRGDALQKRRTMMKAWDNFCANAQ